MKKSSVYSVMVLLSFLLLVTFKSPAVSEMESNRTTWNEKKTEMAPKEAKEKQVMVIWHTETEPQSIAAMQEIISDFEKLHPGFQVKQMGLRWNELESRLIAAISTGEFPDLSHGQPITCAAFQKKGLLRPLDDVVTSIGKDNIWDGVRKIGYYGGHQYGLAHAAGTSLLIYRADLFKEKGLEPPRTWDDFLRVLAALTEDLDDDGSIDRYGMLMPGSRLFLNIGLAELIKSNGGRLFTAQKNPALLENPMMELLKFYTDVSKYMPPDWVRYEYADTFKALAEGKVAMLYQGYGRGVGYIKKYADPGIADLSHFAVMKKPHGPSANQSAVQVDAEPWMIFKDAKHSEMAAEFLKFFYRDENYIKYIKSVPIHFFPVTKSLRRNSSYKNIPMIKEWGQWLDIQGYYLSNDLAKPTLVVNWKDLEELPFLMEVLSSGILSDMILDTSYKGVSYKTAAQVAQQKLEHFLKTIR